MTNQYETKLADNIHNTHLCADAADRPVYNESHYIRSAWGIPTYTVVDDPLSTVKNLEPPQAEPNVFKQQVGGNHYSTMPDGYQPFQISYACGLNPVEHTILKYLLRWRKKEGKQDLLKIKHCVDLLIEQECK